MDNQCTAGLDEVRIVAEALKVGFFCAVDVEMVGIGGCDDSCVGTEMMERAIKLVSFYHHIVRFI